MSAACHFAESQPSTLHRDRRPYEPLQIQADEIWPQYELTLLDIVPSPRDLSAPGIADRREGTKLCQELLKHLYNSPKLPVPVALDRIAPNAAQDLIPEIPTITDARRGGRLDVSKMSVRMLTPEMVEELVKAFLECHLGLRLWRWRLRRTRALRGRRMRRMGRLSRGSEELCMCICICIILVKLER